MKEHKIYGVSICVQRVSFKSSLESFFVLFLRFFLGIPIISFYIPSALGGPVSHKTKDIVSIGEVEGEALINNFTRFTANLFIGQENLQGHLPDKGKVFSPSLEDDPDGTDLGQKEDTSFPLKSLNVVHDTVQDLLAHTTNEGLKYEIKFLWLKLKKKILSDNLSLPQIIDLLGKNISRGGLPAYMKSASAQLIRALLTKHPLSEDTEALRTVDALLKELSSHKQLRNHTHASYLQVLETILGQFGLPETELLWIFHQVKENLFHINKFVREGVIQVIKRVLIKISDTEKERIIFWTANYLTDRDWKNRLFALIALNEFLKNNLLPNSDGMRRVAFMIRDRIIDEIWEVREKAITTSGILLNRTNILSDSNEKRETALMIRDRIIDENGRVRKAAITTSAMLLSRKDMLSDFNERRETALMIKNRITDEDGRVKEAAIIASSVLLNQQDVLFDSHERREIAFMIADQLAYPDRKIQKASVLILSMLLSQKDILSDFNDRKKITLLLLEQLSDKNWEVQKEGIKTLRTLLSQQSALFDSNDRKRIARMLPQWLAHEDWTIQKEAIDISGILLKHINWPDSELSEIYYTVAGLIFHEEWVIRYSAFKVIKSLWSSDFSRPKKIEIMNLIANRLPKTSHGQKKAIRVLNLASHAGLPLDFNIIDKVTGKVSEPSPLGGKAASFVKKSLSLKNTILSDEERLMVFLKMDRLRLERNHHTQKLSDENTACEESMRSVSDTE